MKNKFNSIPAMLTKYGATLCLAATTATMLAPVTVYATEESVNIASGQNLEINSGLIGTNDGTISRNDGSVEYNNGEISNNNVQGSVGDNGETGVIRSNSGTVTNNFGTVQGLEPTGVVRRNETGGSVSGTAGTIDHNVGGSVTVDHSLDMGNNSYVTISEYYSGDYNVADTSETSNDMLIITHNYSGSLIENTDHIVAENQYYEVAVTGADNTDVTYSGITQNAYNQKNYIKVEENGDITPINGIITLQAKNGYEITDNGLEDVTTDHLVYTIEKNTAGAYVVTISYLDGNITLSPSALNLIITALQNGGNAGDKIEVKVDGSVKTSDDNGGGSDPAQGKAQIEGVIAAPQVIVGDKQYKSTVSGAFITQNIAIAVVAPAAELKNKAGLGAGESLYFKGWEFTAKQSPLAYQALTDVAGKVGGNVLQCVELNFGKMTFGKFSELDEQIVSRTTICLPKKADKNKKHALARAAKGGKTQVLENFSEDSNVITSDIPGGAAAYAIVEY